MSAKEKKNNNLCAEYRIVYYSTILTPLSHSNLHRDTRIHILHVLLFCKQIARSSLVPENVYVSIGELQGHNQTAYGDSRCLRLGSIRLAKRYASASVNPPRKRHTKYVEHPFELLLLFFLESFPRSNASLAFACIYRLLCSSLRVPCLLGGSSLYPDSRSIPYSLLRDFIVYYFLFIVY